MLAVLWLALSWAMPRPARVPWTALVPGAGLFAVGFLAFTLAVVALLLAAIAAATWRIQHRRPRPEPTT